MRAATIVLIVALCPLPAFAAKAKKYPDPIGAPAPPPLQIGPVEQHFGDWIVLPGRGMIVLRTPSLPDPRQPAAGVFGAACSTSDGTCTYYVGGILKCNDGEPAYGLITSDEGSGAIALHCTWIGNVQYLAIDTESEPIITGALKTGGVFGVAFGSKDGTFITSKFSAFGSSVAAAEANKYLPQKLSPPAPQ